MRLDELPRSDKVEDRRGDGSGGFPMGRTGGIGIGTIILLGLLGWALGINPLYLICGAEILLGLGGSLRQRTGASRIHGDLLMLGFEVAQSTVSKYMVRGGPPSQGWKTFFRNHAQAIAAIDLFVVPTLTFERLFAFLVLGHGRRQLLWFEVTRHPTAEWLARQITEAFPWATAPAYLVRDNDRAYG